MLSSRPDRGRGGVVRSAAASRSHATSVRSVTILPDHFWLPGTLAVPTDAVGIVVFAHGSGSSRFSARNVAVASALNEARLGTLLFDLLTEDEAIDRRNVFDVPLLARRVESAVEWLASQAETRHLPVGLFGASTGAAAALWAAAERGNAIGAVVSRGGRPDLARARLAEVAAPTLLVVGGRDELVLELNRSALPQLRCPAALRIVPGATHLFEEPGALARVADLAADWFCGHLPGTP